MKFGLVVVTDVQVSIYTSDPMRRFAFMKDKIVIKIVLDPFAKRWDQCKHGLDLCLHWQWSSDEAKPVMKNDVIILCILMSV